MTDAELRQRVKGMIVLCCRLKMLPAELKDDQELFDPAKGPGLDSIDVLELVVNLEREFGVVIPDRESGRRILRSVDTIVEFINASGKK
ncbi:MAG TPA: acyl carrier protein [Planctomycetota bacterium]|nr:acyl carrier protein [Planctomycetota bacterium]